MPLKGLFERIEQGAAFSPDRLYRYRLWRTWGDASPINFLMLNPSTADEINNDPTVERCERRARAYGAGGLIVTNIFAYRSTDPTVLASLADPVGPENDTHILEAARDASMVICAWGQDGRVRGRQDAVLRLLKSFTLHALRVSDAGFPCHPLYLSYALRPAPWRKGEDGSYALGAIR